MGRAFAGIDVDRAGAVVGAWRGAAGRVGGAVQRAARLGDELGLDAGVVRRHGGRVVDELQAAAELLDARAAAMAGIRWARDDDAELVEWLATGARGSLVTALREPDPAAWAAMVAAGSTTDGARTRRFVDIAAEPGAGVIVVDVFIPERRSLIVEGDGRPHADPVFGDLDDGDSRMVVVADLGAGRASVQLDDTCLAGGRICNEARPIETGGAEVVWAPSTDWGDHVVAGVPGPVELLEIPNQVSLRSRPGRLTIDYDILNGIIPTPSVDGTVTVATDGAGGARVVDLDSDGYPSIGVYHYGEGRTVDVLARQDSRGVAHAVPWWQQVVETVGVAAGGLDVAELLERRRGRGD